jgi:hypothetical protein
LKKAMGRARPFHDRHHRKDPAASASMLDHTKRAPSLS